MNFGINKNYVINELNVTNDLVTEGKYWNANRIRMARSYQYPVYTKAAKLIREKGAQSIIDVGCGVGIKLVRLNKLFPQLDIVGIDQPHPIEFCKTHHRFGRWISDDLEASNLSSDVKGDLIICSDVIEHLVNPTLLLDYLKNLMNDQSILILSTPERVLLHGADIMHSPNKHHIREWRASELKSYIEAQGFEIINKISTSSEVWFRPDIL